MLKLLQLNACLAVDILSNDMCYNVYFLILLFSPFFFLTVLLFSSPYITVLVFQECHNNSTYAATYTKKLIVSLIWRLEWQGGSLDSCEGEPFPGLSLGSLQVHMGFSLYMSLYPNFPLYKDTSHLGWEPNLMISP